MVKMSQVAQNEWLSLFTTDVEKIWNTYPSGLRLIFTAHYILQKQLKEFEAQINKNMEHFKHQVKTTEKSIDDNSSFEILPTQNDLSDSNRLIRSPKIQGCRKRLHKNSTSPSLLAVAKSKTEEPLKPLKENSFNLLSNDTATPDLPEVVDSSILISNSPDTSLSKKSKFVKRSDLLRKKKSSSLTLTQLFNTMPTQRDKSDNVKQKDFENLPKRNLFKDYDILPLPKSKSPEYPHKTEAVKKKSERMQLQGWSCAECKEYYSSFELPPEKLKEKMNQCSKHRNKYEPLDDTPKGFWDITIFSSQDD
ncbi:uncharacterized protein LOC116176769 [Photinus pyralis]|uniref:uncharacterized protein LOC116176769 n=1 Tax=Photinus pyralis TaxID=7054 RepID=UPI0012675E50|nr:uncharacterized protein LOC116176769 [Photinus pyralis]